MGLVWAGTTMGNWGRGSSSSSKGCGTLPCLNKDGVDGEAEMRGQQSSETKRTMELRTAAAAAAAAAADLNMRDWGGHGVASL